MPARASSPIPAVLAQLVGTVAPDPLAQAPGLLDALARVVDPRARRGVRHRLVTVLAVSVCAVLAGARSMIAIGEWAAELPSEVRTALDIRACAPEESTIRRVLGLVDGDGLDLIIGTWIAAQLRSVLQARSSAKPPAARVRAATRRRAVAVDGKALRGSRSGPDRRARHLLAVIDHQARVVLGQVDVDTKTNEITRFAPLLDGLDLHDVVVTADALHTQRAHVDYLATRGAHWVLTVKDNQPGLRRQLAALPWPQVETAHHSVNNGHGRRETRTLKIVTIAAGITFPHAAQAIQITRRTRPLRGTGSGSAKPKWRTETVYAITDLRPHQATPADLAAFIRGHWQIENALHWVRDVTFAEDHSQVRTGNAPQVMASLRNLAISALRLNGVVNIASALRHSARDATRPPTILKIM